MTVGAPPDEFFAEGQNWGFPPQLPGAGRRSGHALWRDLVGARRRARLGAAHRPRDGRAPAVVDPRGLRRDRRRVRALPARGAARRHRRRGGAYVDDDRRREPRHGPRGGHRGARAVGRARHVRGAVQPVPPHTPSRRSPPARSPASAPTTCRRSPPPSTATPTGGVYRLPPARRRRRRASRRRRRGRRARRRPRAARRQRRLPRRRRPRRPRRRDRAAQRARQGPAVDVAPPAAPARRPRCSASPTSAGASSCSPTARTARDDDAPNPGRRDRPAPLQRGHPPPPAPAASAPTPTPTGTWFAVWAPERRVASTCSATSTAGTASSRLEPIGGSGIWSAHVAGRARRAVLPLRRHEPRRRADREGRPGRQRPRTCRRRRRR